MKATTTTTSSRTTLGMHTPLFFYFIIVFLLPLSCTSRFANFAREFHVTWADSHVTMVDGGSTVELFLDQSSGCGFAWRNKFLFGHVSMKIKLISGDSAGTVTAFYLSSETGGVRDEVDFEFLGNRSGQPYTVQTNVYAHGKGDREQRVNLWFDPSKDFHTYSILWNHHHVVFFVDAIPIRVYKNNEAKGVAYPNSQPMGIYSTLWNADDWATRGGLEKTNWAAGPFKAYYKDFNIEACAIDPVLGTCGNSLNVFGSWWERASYRQLNSVQARAYRWVRLNHMVYDYCKDRTRFLIIPKECIVGY